MMDKVRLGIIGIGGMGTNHARSILEGKVPQMELTAVADSHVLTGQGKICRKP